MAYKSKFDEIDAKLLKMCRSGHLHVIEEDEAGNPLKMRAMATRFKLYWYFAKLWHDECFYWNTIVGLPAFGKGESFIPICCLNCWKVVAKPRTLKELHYILEVQKSMDIPCKCGIEEREFTSANYGAYWYAYTKEEGQKIYKAIYDLIREPVFGDVPELLLDRYLILKRGCTEFEFGIHGRSDTWKMFDGQVKFEEYIKSKIEIYRATIGQSQFLKNMVLENWLGFAHSRGDLTYPEFNNGERLMPDYVTYHKE